MGVRPQKFWLVIILLWPAVLRAEGFRDSTVTYYWIRSLAEQQDGKLDRAILSLTEDYVRHFPVSPRNSQILQIEGRAWLESGKPFNAFVCFLKQHTVYPDSLRNWQSEKALVHLTLTQRKLRQRANLVATFVGESFARVSFKKRFVIFLNQLYWLDIPEIDKIALREMHYFFKMGLPLNDLDVVVYKRAKILQRNRQWRRALFGYAALLRGWPDSKNVPLSYYHIGEILKQNLKKDSLAKAVFRAFVSKFPNHFLAGLAHFQLAEMEEKDGELKRAVRDYVQFLNQSHERALRALGYYRLGKLFQKKFGEKEKARIFFNQMTSLYPNAQEAKRVAKKLNYLLN